MTTIRLKKSDTITTSLLKNITTVNINGSKRDFSYWRSETNPQKWQIREFKGDVFTKSSYRYSTSAVIKMANSINKVKGVKIILRG